MNLIFKSHGMEQLRKKVRQNIKKHAKTNLQTFWQCTMHIELLQMF